MAIKKTFKKGKAENPDWIFFTPSITDPYVYLKDLYDPPDYRRVAHAIGKYASGMLNMSMGGSSTKYDSQKFNVSTSINFLQIMSQNMLSHEMAYLDHKISELKKFGGEAADEIIA